MCIGYCISTTEQVCVTEPGFCLHFYKVSEVFRRRLAVISCLWSDNNDYLLSSENVVTLTTWHIEVQWFLSTWMVLHVKHSEGS